MRAGALVAAIALALPAAAAAQPPSAEQDAAAAARAEFEAGERAFDESDYEVALAHFRRAHQLLPRDGVRFNIAICLERLGRFRGSLEQYETAAASDELDAATRARAAELAARVRERLGTLVIGGAPEGATVELDGEALCALPCRELVDPGPHLLTLGADRRQVTVERGATVEVRFDVPLAAPSPERPERATRRRGAGPLTWIGLGAAVAGGAGALAFGLRVRSLHDDYVDRPTAGTRDDGLRMRALANASIGLAAAGAAFLFVDLVFLARRQVPAERDVGLAPTGLTVSF